MQHMCERCRRHSDLTYDRHADEYLCDGCLEQSLADRADAEYKEYVKEILDRFYAKQEYPEYTEPAKYGNT